MGNLLQTFLLHCLSLVSQMVLYASATQRLLCVCQQEVVTGYGLQFAELPSIDSVCENK
jgi:hypothetical protein